MHPDPEAVKSRSDLAKFLVEFRADLFANPQTGDCETLEGFLSALSRYLDDVPGYLNNSGSSVHPENPSWQLFAIALCGARVYE